METLDLRRQYKQLYNPSAKRVEIVDVPPLQFAMVDGLIPAGKVGTFVSAGGGGKTSLLMKLGISIATGQSWFGFDLLERGATVLLSGEDDQEDLDGALAELLKVQVEWIRAATSDSPNIAKQP